MLDNPLTQPQKRGRTAGKLPILSGLVALFSAAAPSARAQGQESALFDFPNPNTVGDEAVSPLLASPASAERRHVLIAGSFAVTRGATPIIVASSFPQSSSIYPTAKACKFAAGVYTDIASLYITDAANILAPTDAHSAFVVAVCEPAAWNTAPGSTLQFNLTTGVGDLARGTNGNAISISAGIASPADCKTAKADVVAALKPMVDLLTPRFSGAYCY